MFTRATRSFGIWRENHVNFRRFAGNPTSGFVTAMAAAAFVSALCFFVTWKVRGDFFLVESAQVDLAKAKVNEKWLTGPRPSALTFAMIPASGREFDVVFERGETFRFPGEKDVFVGYVRTRLEGIELQAMMTMRVQASLSRVQIWPHRNIDPASLNELMNLLTREGLDDFDIALAPGSGEKSL